MLIGKIVKELQPCFIVFDGTEGAGKTTIMNSLMEKMTSEFIRTREPGGTAVGEEIRKILLHPEHGPSMSVTTNALLFAASYRNSLHTRIIPALQEGKVVISDRTNITCFVYQAESEHIKELVEFNDMLRAPDIVFVMTTTHAESKRRLEARSDANKNWRDFIDEETHNKYVSRYDEYVNLYPERCVVLDTMKDPEELLEEVISILENRFAKQGI